MGGATSHACQSGVRSFDWTVRCDWLQVASSCILLYTHNIMLMRSARLVQVLQDLLQVLSIVVIAL